MYVSLKVFGLVFGSSKTEVRVQFWEISRIYPPDKQKNENNGMTEEYAKILFRILKIPILI